MTDYIADIVFMQFISQLANFTARSAGRLSDETMGTLQRR